MDKIIDVLETIIDEYGGRAYKDCQLGELLPIEEQNPEIREAILLVKELKENANQKS